MALRTRFDRAWIVAFETSEAARAGLETLRQVAGCGRAVAEVLESGSLRVKLIWKKSCHYSTAQNWVKSSLKVAFRLEACEPTKPPLVGEAALPPATLIGQHVVQKCLSLASEQLEPSLCLGDYSFNSEERLGSGTFLGLLVCMVYLF